MSTRDQPRTQHNEMSSHQSQSQQQSSANNRGFTSEYPAKRHETTSEGDNTREFTPEDTREAGKQDHDQGHAGDRYNVPTRTAGSPERQHAEAGRLSHKGDIGSASEKH